MRPHCLPLHTAWPPGAPAACNHPRCSPLTSLQVPTGPRTLGALRNNISVSIQYLEAWLGGNGCVPLHNLMEDAATAEIRWVLALLAHVHARMHATAGRGLPATPGRAALHC